MKSTKEVPLDKLGILSAIQDFRLLFPLVWYETTPKKLVFLGPPMPIPWWRWILKLITEKSCSSKLSKQVLGCEKKSARNLFIIYFIVKDEVFFFGVSTQRVYLSVIFPSSRLHDFIKIFCEYVKSRIHLFIYLPIQPCREIPVILWVLMLVWMRLLRLLLWMLALVPITEDLSLATWPSSSPPCNFVAAVLVISESNLNEESTAIQTSLADQEHFLLLRQ